jgi:hypothetical protein
MGVILLSHGYGARFKLERGVSRKGQGLAYQIPSLKNGTEVSFMPDMSRTGQAREDE